MDNKLNGLALTLKMALVANITVHQPQLLTPMINLILIDEPSRHSSPRTQRQLQDVILLFGAMETILPKVHASAFVCEDSRPI